MNVRQRQPSTATPNGNDRADESIAEYKKTCEDAGCQIITLDDSVLAELREKAEPVYEMVREDLGDEIVNQLFDAINAAKQ